MSTEQVTLPGRPRPSGDGSPRTSALLMVLDEGADVLERTVARVDQGIALLGLLIAGYVAVAMSTRLGLTCAALSLAALGWFTAVIQLSRRPRWARRLRWVAPLVEVSLPSVVLLVLASVEGPAYAIASWVPPQLYTVVLLVSLLRLRPAIPAVLGTVAAVEFLGLMYLFLDEVGASADAGSVLSWDVQAVRGLTLFLAGLLSSGVVLAVRRGLDKVAGRARSRDLFGKYRLEEEIASGGMGTVVKATYCPEGGFERPVAIKRIHPHLAREPRFVKGFRQEAELCARLGHPNIVSVLDFGSEGDTYFFAMEYVDGLNLAQVIRRAKAAGLTLPVGVVAFIGRQIAEGLHFAHAGATDAEGKRLRVVHRDLSPTNVLLSWGGEVKVSDFGIARVLRDKDGHHTANLTGKVGYLAPEQAVGESFDERADLFSLGVVLYELLTLEPLFGRDNQAASLLAVLKDEIPDVREKRPDVPEAFAQLLARALTRDVGGRFQSAADVALALDEVLAAEGRPSATELRAFLAELPRHDPPSMDPGISSAGLSSAGLDRDLSTTVNQRRPRR